MKQLISILFLLSFSGCQIDPCTHTPIWTGTDWYDVGIQDAISGYAVRDNETLADNYNDSDVDRTEYLKSYAEGQRRICQQDFVHARGLTGKTFPLGCDTAENVDQLHNIWQQEANKGTASIGLS